MTTTQQAVTVAPTPQASTASYATITGSLINMLQYKTLSFTIKNTGANSIDWKIIAGNMSDLSDAVIVNGAATITAGSYGTAYTATTTPYQWYAVQIIDTVGASHGEATLAGIAKR